MSQRSCQDQPDENRLDSLIHSLEKLAGNTGPGAIGGADTSSSIDNITPGLKSKKTARGKEVLSTRTATPFMLHVQPFLTNHLNCVTLILEGRQEKNKCALPHDSSVGPKWTMHGELLQPC